MFNWGGYDYYGFMKLSLRKLLKRNQVNMYVHWTPHMYRALTPYHIFFCYHLNPDLIKSIVPSTFYTQHSIMTRHLLFFNLLN